MKHDQQQTNGPRTASAVSSSRKQEEPTAIPFAQRLTCTVAEACVATGLGRTKLYELIGGGQVETTTIGRRRLVQIRSLRQLVNSGDR
jgi:excisionase family DNA binding protein